jgi:hypothetical protein
VTQERVVFLHSGGQSVEVDPEAARLLGKPAGFCEPLDGVSVALLAHGMFWVNDLECVDGVFVVLRVTR